MKKRRLGTVGLLAIGLVLVLCSCGGGSSANKRLSKAQFASKADSLCAAFNAEVKKAGSPQNTAEVVVFYNKLLPLDQKLVSDFAKLKPPANEQATVSRLVTLGKEQAVRAKALIAAIKKNDLTTARKFIAEGNANSKESKTLFGQIGSAECAKSS
jgi:hypothetical protein